MAVKSGSGRQGDEEYAVISQLRALIIPGTPDEQRRRRLLVLDNVRHGYMDQPGGEPQWLVDLCGRVTRGESLQRAKTTIDGSLPGE
ncbi:hypothetical protein BH20GEM3_BH20GEM3_00240 [soil metagenome]|jgi:hypothetical protein